MSDRIFSGNERKTVEAMAHRRGFKTVREYMRSLIDSDATHHGEIAPFVEDINDDDDAVRAAIKQGMREALRGDVLTEEEFWKAIAEDE